LSRDFDNNLNYKKMKQTKHVFLLAIVVMLVGACGSDENSYENREQPDGSVLMRIGKHDYLTFMYGDTRWMVENSKEGNYSGKAYGRDANGNAIGSFDNDTDIYDGQENGYYYTVDQATSACPSGWSLPTYEEAETLKLLLLSAPDDSRKWWEGAKGTLFGAYAGVAGGEQIQWGCYGTSGHWFCKMETEIRGFSLTLAGRNWIEGVGGSPQWRSVRCVQR
jgi:uncharacterized protein (TIGR02145 family)